MTEQSPKQRAATERNWLIRRLRGAYRLFYWMHDPKALLICTLINELLASMGARKESGIGERHDD